MSTRFSLRLSAAVLALFAFVSMQTASAQTEGRSAVTGTVVDSTDGLPLPGATVVLVHAAPDSARAGAATSVDGAFRVDVLPGAYRLRVSFVGYETLDRAVTVGGSLALGELRLGTDAASLGEASVVGLRQRVEVRGDTTAFNAEAFAVNPDADAQDLITKMPGVVVENGTVTAQGETVQRVLIDGREVFGTDVQGALRSLPAEIVKEVQVYDRASEASRFSGFDDGNAEKTINIVTRTGAQNGQFGRAYAGAGPTGEYLAGGNVSLLDGDRRITAVALVNNVDQQNFSTEDLLGTVGASSAGRGGGRSGGGGGRRGGSQDVSNLLVPDQTGINTTTALGVNYNDKLLDGAVTVTGSYVFNNTDTDLNASLSRAYTTGDAVSQLYDQSNTGAGGNTNHQASARVQANLSETTQLVVQPRLTVQTNSIASTLFGQTRLPSGDPLAQSTTTTDGSGTGVSASTSVLLRHRFAAPGRTLTVGLDGGVDDRSTDSRQATTLDSFADDTADATNDQLFDVGALTRSLGGQLSYTEPIGGRSQLQLTYRPQLSWSSSDQNAFLADGTGAFTIPDSAYTSAFRQTSVVQRGGLSYRLQGASREAPSAQIGVDVQNERLEGEQAGVFAVDRSFWSVLPSARLQLPLAEGKRLSLDYRARTQTPSATQLQDVVDNSNPLLLTTGNPDLRPATTHTARLRLNATDAAGGSVLAGFLSGSYGVNAIGTATTTALVDTEVAPGIVLPAGAQLRQPVNVDGSWNARALVSYGRPVPLLGSNANVSLGTSFTRAPGLIDGDRNVSDQLGLDGRVFLGSSVSPRLDASLEYGARVTAVSNSAFPTLDDTYVRHLGVGKLTWLPGGGLVLSTDVSAIHYSGLDQSVDPTQVLVGGRVGYKFLAGDLAEVSLSVTDLFNQQRDVERTVTESYVEDAQTTALGRYVMLNLSYKLRNFGL